VFVSSASATGQSLVPIADARWICVGLADKPTGSPPHGGQYRLARLVRAGDVQQSERDVSGVTRHGVERAVTGFID
jgi:hypothetical protein